MPKLTEEEIRSFPVRSVAIQEVHVTDGGQTIIITADCVYKALLTSFRYGGHVYEFNHAIPGFADNSSLPHIDLTFKAL